MLRRNLTLAAVTAVTAFVTFPSAANATDVCNEAENSYRGGYTVSGDPVDPNPPARLKGGPGAQMRVGNGHGEGLVNAAFHSPALRTCGPGNGDTTGGGDTGGGDDGGGPVFDV